MEDRFGHDFSRVRLHHDREADVAAREMEARAFATGPDIFLRHDVPEPDASAEGLHLLAHELAHVVQFERSGGSAGAEEDTPLHTSHDESAEVEARTAADAVVAGEGAHVDATPSAPVARDDDERGFSMSMLPPKLQYGFGALGGDANLSLGLGGLGAEYKNGLFHGDASLGYTGSAGLNLGLGAPLQPWVMDVNRDLTGAAGGVNSLMNGGGLNSATLGALGGFGALGDVAGAGAPSPYRWGAGLQLSHSDEESRVMLGARMNF